MEKLYAEVDKGAAYVLTKFALDQIRGQKKLANTVVRNLTGSLAFLEKNAVVGHALIFALFLTRSSTLKRYFLNAKEEMTKQLKAYKNYHAAMVQLLGNVTKQYNKDKKVKADV